MELSDRERRGIREQLNGGELSEDQELESLQFLIDDRRARETELRCSRCGCVYEVLRTLIGRKCGHRDWDEHGPLRPCDGRLELREVTR